MSTKPKKKKKYKQKKTENREQKAHMSKKSFRAAMLRQRQAKMKTAASSEHIERQPRLEEGGKKKEDNTLRKAMRPPCCEPR